MGISISIFEGSIPNYPLDIEMRLICDGHAHLRLDLLEGRGPMYQAFRHPDGFIGCYSSAMAAGWKDTFRGGRRVFLGPCCSGKVRNHEFRARIRAQSERRQRKVDKHLEIWGLRR